jgi:hypothetical protein
MTMAKSAEEEFEEVLADARQHGAGDDLVRADQEFEQFRAEREPPGESHMPARAKAAARYLGLRTAEDKDERRGHRDAVHLVRGWMVKQRYRSMARAAAQAGADARRKAGRS